ncbi:hypothetical protein HMPREF0991_01902 [Lachnospiraceae bacterium 2_1_58FAA]|uniref:hypothetical protein n=1 Tax=Mediterraneibacter gnavus TaxID=33038 RepID=UPI000213407D|nr:hypothetical protein [Mediterraneibacter gnavus]EGN47381.1 hypothetical protein HMPREF0991_01902 [Lachnospiraceae bacterium 2_1_58FAA]
MKKREMTIFGRFKSIRDAMMLSFSVLVVVAVLIFLLIAMNFTKKQYTRIPELRLLS